MVKGGIPTELWDTTYNDYGRFYKAAKLEDAASRCEKKCEKLSRELMDCQKKLDELKLRTQHTAGTGESSGPSRRALREMCRYQTGIPNLRVPSYTHAPEEEDIKSLQQLSQEELHLMRMKKREQDLYALRMKNVVPSYRYRQLFPAEYNMEHKNYPPPSPRVYDLQPQKPRMPDRISAPFHPAVSRYTHYKFYGCGGHGAKTSWGHNMPLGRRVRHCKRTRILPSYL